MTEREVKIVTTKDYGIVPKEGELFDAGRALNSIIKILHPQETETATDKSQPVFEEGRGSKLVGDSVDFQKKAFDFWRRAAMTISDLHNPDVRNVILDTEMPNKPLNRKEDELIVIESRKTQVATIISKLKPDQREQLRTDYNFLSRPELTEAKIDKSLLWRAIPIAAGEEDQRMVGHVRLQNDAFIRASKEKISLRPTTPSK